ncbi:hypothetical protein Poli38472_011531 [Pythium oligandrum]|uniref:AAA+ ATPase domain-containing protein n=1 Tax=Pythium oligandrum TaxID=41045 RepID=A0A8K1FJ85_PYTOL|nr:hypothetical protein Poli38472_011531 [Pythium oligandrum]|eukprot:TMW64651.1 hypothetical protein Poli38472_011531 [Pythium oligandrum]
MPPPPSIARQPAPRDAPSRLVWVKLRLMQVFWPACVYETYSAATEHAHDLSKLRASKPVLDAEDRVVCFFGAGKTASMASTPGIAPNLQFCIVPEEELSTFVWEGADDFDKVCRTYHVPEECIERALKNRVFQRACEDATKYADAVESDEDASRLFMTFLMRDCGVRGRQVSDPATVVRAIEEAQEEAHDEDEPMEEEPVSVQAQAPSAMPQAGLSLTQELMAKCWPLMQKEGWSLLKQGDGSEFYTTPGTSFFDFKPNVTVFDVLESACVKFLRQWSAEDGNNSDSEDIGNVVWELLESRGWKTMTNANETWYISPNTSFDQFIPNVTVFCSRQKALSRVLQGPGAVGKNLDTTSHDKHDHGTDNEVGSRSGAESADEAVESKVDYEMASASSDGGEVSEDMDDDEEESEYEEGIAKLISRPLSSRSDKASSSKANKSAQPQKSASTRKQVAKRKSKVTRPAVVIPPFECKFGMIERELRSRGWFWKPSNLGYKYYMPECRNKPARECVQDKDFFLGQSGLEEYLTNSGLYDELREKLRFDHESLYRPAESRSAGHNSVIVSASNPVKRARATDVFEFNEVDTHTPRTRPSPREKPSGASRRTPALSQIKRRAPPPPKPIEVKFGEIWDQLRVEGWECRPGTFEYDYFLPHCKSTQEGQPGKDYFQGKDALIDFLHESGVWERVASEVRREIHAAITQEADRKRKSPVENVVDLTSLGELESHTPKRVKQDEKPKHRSPGVPSTNAVTPKSDKNGTSAKVSTSTTSSGRSFMSPDVSTSRVRTESKPVAQAQLSRSLSNVFTPSPEVGKKTGGVVGSPRRMALDIIDRLTLAHVPSRLEHRENEARMIQNFCRDCFSQSQGGSMYLSGSPGCGKSALMRSLQPEITRLFEEAQGSSQQLVWSHINAMGLSSFDRLFCQVAEKLTNQAYTDGEQAFEALERSVNNSTKRSKTLLLVVDEIDALSKTSRSEDDLSRLFELAHRSGHSFVLVGIANQIDFTDRHLNLLRRIVPTAKPKVLVFEPYPFQTIADILIDRFGGEDKAGKLINTNGLKFIARKVASMSGDVRLALDVARRVLQLRVGDVDSNKAGADFPVSLSDTVQAVKKVLETKSKSAASSLPRNLQMILFASTRLVSRTTPSEPTSSPENAENVLYHVDDLYECYCDVSRQAGVYKPLTRSEFKIGLDTLSSEGMLGAQELKKQLIKLQCAPSQLLQNFKNDEYFARLL